MARKDIRVPLDRENRNNHNDNYTQLFEGVQQVKKTLDDLVLESGGDSNLEVVQARGGENTLNSRLDKLDDKDYELTSQLAQIAINVKEFGATGDGETDDTENINNAIDSIQSGTVFFPIGTYLINGELEGQTYESVGGIILHDNIILQFAEGAILKVMPSESEFYSVITIKDCNNVSVLGATIYGDRSEHRGVTGEWGHGVKVIRGENINIKNVRVSDCWGDGVYFRDTKNVTVEYVISDNNRRQGMSIVGGENISVRSSVFKNTNGTQPETGVDIEPNHDYQVVKNISFNDCSFHDNVSKGLMLFTNGGTFEDIVVNNCSFSGNGAESFRVSGRGNHCNIKITNSTLEHMALGTSATHVLNASADNVIITNNYIDKIVLNNTSNSIISKNIIIENIVLVDSNTNIRIENNIFNDASDIDRIRLLYDEVYDDASKYIYITNNTISGGKRGVFVQSTEFLSLYSAINIKDNMFIGLSEDGVSGELARSTVEGNDFVNCNRGVWLGSNSRISVIQDNRFREISDSDVSGATENPAITIQNNFDW